MAKKSFHFQLFPLSRIPTRYAATTVTAMMSLTLLFEFKAENGMGRESGGNRMGMGEKSQGELFYCGT